MPITPPLAMMCNMSLVSENAWWDANDNTNDPFIGYPYRWVVSITTQDQPHNSHATPTPNAYTGMDIKVGDWFASGTNGRANLIVEIQEQTYGSLTVILEDVERYNLFTDPLQQGNGLCDEGEGLIFRLDEDGFPILGPVQDYYFAENTIADLQARFMSLNATEHVLVNQHNHGMFVGDVICADFDGSTAGYKKVTSDDFNRAIGIVVEANVPGLDYFSYRPIGKLVNNVSPALWGNHGDVFYMDPNEPGGLTNVKPTTGIAIPVYLQLDLPTRAILLERGAEVEHVAESETNKYDVESVASGQTTFTMPNDAKEILYMAINGIENENFTFDTSSKVLTFDPIETGYGVDVDDEVFFIYKT